MEHGRVIYIAPGGALRLDSAIGPLQEMGVTGVLAITLEPGADSKHAKLRMTYKVSGAAGLQLDKLGSVVDQVLGAQFVTLSNAP